ncbi:VTT domain-containing protein [Sphingomonas hengshuiensis]|uniref:VTT domain-containing protein n=1 Tax=Sphingomonas hengshuiensis TaxID=1609977 RepID=UPI0005C83403|nr:VTT domain-containing protein [Sphingomonas hengshuiensis]
MQASLQSALRIAAAILLLAMFVLVPFFLFGPTLEARMAGSIGVPGVATAMAGGTLLALDIVLPVPSSLVATAMGAALGGWPGALVNTLGLTAGCLLGLVIGRSGSPLAGRILGPALYARFVLWIERNGVAAVLLCRAVPVLAEASIVAAGTAKGRTGPLLAAAGFADLCLGVLYAVAGAAQGPAAAPSAPAFAAAVGIPVLAAIVSLSWIRRRPRS